MASNRDTVILERRFFPKDANIIKEGDEGHSAFLIQSGEVQIFKTMDGKQLTLAEIGSGAIFGEMTLLFDEKRTASARALTDCNLIVINRQTLDEKLRKSDPTIRAIMQSLVKRLDTSTKKWVETSLYVDFADAMQDLFTKAIDQIPHDNKKPFKRDAGPIVEEFIWLVEKYSQEGIEFE